MKVNKIYLSISHWNLFSVAGLILISVLLSACSDDGNNAITPPDSLFGEWTNPQPWQYHGVDYTYRFSFLADGSISTVTQGTLNMISFVSYERSGKYTLFNPIPVVSGVQAYPIDIHWLEPIGPGVFDEDDPEYTRGLIYLDGDMLYTSFLLDSCCAERMDDLYYNVTFFRAP